MIFEILLLASIGLYDAFQIPLSIGTVSLVDIVCGFFFSIYIVRKLLSREVPVRKINRGSRVVILLFVLLTFSSILATINSDSSMVSMKAIYNFSVITIVTVLMIVRIQEIESLATLLNIWTRFAVCFSMIAVLAAFNIVHIPWISDYPHSREIADFTLPFNRSAGLFENYSSFGMFVIYALPYSLVKMMETFSLNGGFFKNILLLGAKFFILGILLFGILMPQSRGFFIGGAFVTAFTFLLYSLRFQGLLLKVFSGIMLALTMILLLMQLETIIGMFYSMGRENFDFRIMTLKKALESVTFFGNGYDSFMYQIGKVTHIHNGFINLLYSFGVFGVSIFVALNVVCVVTLSRMYFCRNRRFAAIAVCLFGTLAGCHVISLSVSAVALNHYWIIYSLITILQNSHENEVEKRDLEDEAGLHETMQGRMDYGSVS